MPKRRSYIAPVLASVPSSIKDSSLRNYLISLQTNLQQFMRDTIQVGADYDLISNVTRQSLSAGFTITPDSHDIEIYSASAIISDTTTAIKDGRNGQTIVLHNTGSNTITIKNGANTEITEDIVLNTNDTLTLRWSTIIDSWVELSTGGLTSLTHGNIQSATAVGNIGGGEDDLLSWVIPANIMTASSDIDIVTEIIAAANANVKTIKFHIGTSSIVINPTTIIPNNIFLTVKIKVWYRTSTSARVNVLVFLSTGVIELVGSQNFTTGIDWTTTNTLKFTAIATANDDVTQRYVSFIVHRML